MVATTLTDPNYRPYRLVAVVHYCSPKISIKYRCSISARTHIKSDATGQTIRPAATADRRAGGKVHTDGRRVRRGRRSVARQHIARLCEQRIIARDFTVGTQHCSRRLHLTSAAAQRTCRPRRPDIIGTQTWQNLTRRAIIQSRTFHSKRTCISAQENQKCNHTLTRR
jgi:hypothetical protein